MYLNQLHVLRAVWKWLQLSTHGVAREHRPSLYAAVKELVYAQTATDLTYQLVIHPYPTRRGSIF